MVAMGSSSRAAWLACFALAGCVSGRLPRAGAAASPAGTLPAAAEQFVRPSRILPDIPDTARPIAVGPDGSKHFLLMNMRLTEHPDGSLQRAPGLLPSGPTKLLSVELPPRLGGGYLFASSSVAGTQVWRADTWLSPLQPLLRFSQAITDLLPGFDRVYARNARTPTAFLAFDPSDGSWLDLGRLPVPLRFGPALFADSWRGVVVSDLRGPLTTFDGGATWLPVPIAGDVARIESRGAGLLVRTATGSMIVGPDGSLVEQGPDDVASDAGSAAAVEPESARSTAPERPLGRRPLRIAIERGYPYRDGTAVVAYGGSIAEVSLVDGRIVRIAHDAYPESYTSCQGMRLGGAIGFACGEPFGATTVFRLRDELTLEKVMQWPKPAAVFPSANGALVVRAPCPGSRVRDDDLRYCVRDPRGRTRELRFEGDVGAERVVPLSDGRIAIIVAPRPGAAGRLVLLDGPAAVTRELSFVGVPSNMASMIGRGLWMQGAQELRPGVIGLWVEVGGPLVGIRIDTDGRVSSGVSQPPSAVMIVSGRFGLVWRNSGESLETTDGGASWAEFDMPSEWQQTADATRSCSAVGCVVGGLLRVGWGPTAGQAEERPASESPRVTSPPYHQPLHASLQCIPTGRASPPALPDSNSPSAALPLPHVRVPRPIAPSVLDTDPRSRGWLPFGSAPAPALSADEVGVASGRDYGDFRFRAYVWGARSADWSRTGRFVVRVDDPHDALSGPWSTAVFASPWPDLTTALLRIGNVTAAELDPSGRAAVIAWCPMPTQCESFGVAPGEAPLPLLTTDPAGLPPLDSVVRSEESWYLLGRRTGPASVLWAADRSGVTSRIATLPRTGGAYVDDVTVVRKARSGGVGLWTASSDLMGNSSWVVLPVNPATGRVQEPIVVGPTDFGGVIPPRCAPGQDGWLADVSVPTAIDLTSAAGEHFGGSIRVLMRAGAGWECIDSITARARLAEFAAKAGKATPPDDRAIPLVAWDQQENRRYELRCVVQK